MKQHGFIALMSVIIISAVLLGAAATASTAGFFARFNELNAEYKKTASGLAESCINTALLNLAQNYTYTLATPVDVSFDTGICTIQSIGDIGTPSGTARTVVITATAGYQGAFSTVEAGATVANPASASPAVYPITINSWREIN
jgi:hypothetical protein